MPWLHLLPRRWYASMLRRFDEPLDELLEIWQTRLSIERFQRILRRQGYGVLSRKLYLVNPIYRNKFGLRPIRQSRFIATIPLLRNFLSTCAYYLVEDKHRSVHLDAMPGEYREQGSQASSAYGVKI